MNDHATSFLEAYIEPIRPALLDPHIVEVCVNSDGHIWVERQGASHMELFDAHRFQPEAAANLGTSIANELKLSFSETKPILSGKIEYRGKPLRAQVVAAPAVDGGTVLSLRSYSQQKIVLQHWGLLHEKLVDLDGLRRLRAQEVADLAGKGDVEGAMRLCIEDRLNVMISGGTSSGKTTFARGLLDMVDPAERIITIEDAYELFPGQPNVVSLKASRTEGSEATAAKLLEASLRLRPDRIILGELRGSECKTFLDAINTGHGGSFTTIHADTGVKAIDRLALMIMSVGINMNFEEVRRYCSTTIDIVVQLGRVDGRRGIAELFIPSLHMNAES